MAIVPVQLARVSNLLRTQVTTGQITSTQEQLLKVQNELSTGKRINSPSDDPGDAAIVQQLQKTLEQRDSYMTNLQHAQSTLSEADTAMGDLTGLLQQAQQIASANVGSDVTADQRVGAAAVVENLYNQALTLGNRQFEGSYLFGGDTSTEAPYVSVVGGVRYQGTGAQLLNQFDENTSQSFTVAAPDILGGFSGQVKGTQNLAPTVTGSTRLADLGGSTGNGVKPGSIQISNGTITKVVDLSTADSLANVVSAINAAGVGGVTASIAGSGDKLQLSAGAGDNISVTEVGGGSVAADLGILTPIPGGAGVNVVGQTVNPLVTEFTPLASVNGGAGINGAGLTITNGQTTATVAVPPGGTVGDLLNAINASGTGVRATINDARTGIDIVNPIQGVAMSIGENGGTTAADLGIRSMSTNTTLAALNGGKGVATLPTGPEFQITRTDGTGFNVDIDGATTVQDVINAINTASGGVGLTASFATTGNGIVLTDTAGGAGQMQVTALNGSSAAADLGIAGVAPVGNVITGTDVNAPTVDGVFTSLNKLREALQTNDQAGITEAAGKLDEDASRVVRVRGETGARVQEMEARQSRLEDQNVATKSLLSSLSDTDFTDAIARFQTLQTALQATMQTSGQILNLSLLDFLR
jgi:flagellin-like hook-associated protein FlgL